MTIRDAQVKCLAREDDVVVVMFRTTLEKQQKHGHGLIGRFQAHVCSLLALYGGDNSETAAASGFGRVDHSHRSLAAVFYNSSFMARLRAQTLAFNCDCFVCQNPANTMTTVALIDASSAVQVSVPNLLRCCSYEF
jgi:hypothetical protein